MCIQSHISYSLKRSWILIPGQEPKYTLWQAFLDMVQIEKEIILILLSIFNQTYGRMNRKSIHALSHQSFLLYPSYL